MKSRPLRYPSASRTTMPFTAVSLYPNSNLPLRITLGAPEHNGSATMEVTADKENKYTHRHTQGTNIQDVCVCVCVESRAEESFKPRSCEV